MKKDKDGEGRRNAGNWAYSLMGDLFFMVGPVKNWARASLIEQGRSQPSSWRGGGG